MHFASRKVSNFEIFNLGSEDWISVKEISEIICKELILTPRVKFGSNNRGCKGDVPLMLLDISKIKQLGWKPKFNSKNAVALTVKIINRK